MKNNKILLATAIILILLLTGLAYAIGWDDLKNIGGEALKTGTDLVNKGKAAIGGELGNDEITSIDSEYKSLIADINKFNEIKMPEYGKDFTQFYTQKKNILGTIIKKADSLIKKTGATAKDPNLQTIFKEATKVKKYAEDLLIKINAFESADRKDTSDQIIRDGIDKNGGFFWTDTKFENTRLTIPTEVSMADTTGTVDGGSFWDDIKSWTNPQKAAGSIIKSWITENVPFGGFIVEHPLISIGMIIFVPIILVFLIWNLGKKASKKILGFAFWTLPKFIILFIKKFLYALWVASTAKVITPPQLVGWKKVVVIIIAKAKLFLKVLILSKKKIEEAKKTEKESKKPKEGKPDETETQQKPPEKDPVIKEIEEADKILNQVGEDTLKAIQLFKEGKITEEQFMKAMQTEQKVEIQQKEEVDLAKLKVKEVEIIITLQKLDQEWKGKTHGGGILDYQEKYEKAKKRYEEELEKTRKEISNQLSKIKGRTIKVEDTGVRERASYSQEELVHRNAHERFARITTNPHEKAQERFARITGQQAQEKQKQTITERITSKIPKIKNPFAKKEEKPQQETISPPAQKQEKPKEEKKTGIKNILKGLW